MSLFKTWAELRQESRYTRSKASGFNVSSAYVLKSDMDLYSPVDAAVICLRVITLPFFLLFLESIRLDNQVCFRPYPWM